MLVAAISDLAVGIDSASDHGIAKECDIPKGIEITRTVRTGKSSIAKSNRLKIKI